MASEEATRATVFRSAAELERAFFPNWHKRLKEKGEHRPAAVGASLAAQALRRVRRELQASPNATT
ncbi:MAG: hypothetical protein FJ291_26130 [Planctomycetes bacterium]|nr:hypothetical protein [Planctomycetota bacterium]